MAIRQKLKGEQNKTYDVLVNFNKGIDKKSADDLAEDTSFRKLDNFWNEKEGILTKRPGLYDTHFLEIIDHICNEHSLCNFSVITNLNNNLYDKLNEFNNTVLKGNPLYYDGEVFSTTILYNKRLIPLNIIGMQILRDDNFHALLEHYNLDEDNIFGANGIPETFEFNALFICGCENQQLNETYNYWEPMYYGGDKALIITKLNIKRMTQNGVIYCDIEQVNTGDNYYMQNDPTFDSIPIYRWGFNLSLDEPLDIVNYNDYTYIPTGYNYMIRVKNEFPSSNSGMNYNNVPIPTGYFNENPKQESIMIVPIGGLTKENLYKPTPVEVNNIGFNILAQDPLNFYEEGTGTADAIKGVFFSYTKNNVNEPIINIPPNAPFNVHIMSTGASSLGTPQYRPNNGDTDTTTNAYKDIPGSWADQSHKIWACTGINYDGEIEIKITKGNAIYIAYVSTGSNYTQEIGYVSNIKDLVYSSKHIKIINNQLVLYGGHGYIFFSDYENFQYFPNYFFLYAATDAEEKEVTNISYFRQYYAVFTNKRIKRMSGTFGSDNFGLYPLNDFVGCPNGRTVRQVNNNLFFLNIDGLYRLKQGYVGEGTENVEKIDDVLGNELNSSNVLQSFVLNDYYIMVRKDKSSLMIYDYSKDIFFEFNLESLQCPVALNPSINITGFKSYLYFDEENEECYSKNYPLNFSDFKEEYRPFKICFQNELFDEYGSSIYVPEYEYVYSHELTSFVEGSNTYPCHDLIVNRSILHLRKLRMSDLSFLEKENRHKDAIGFISEMETPKLNMGTPTNTKKFKELYLKMTNENLEAIPLYLSIYIDDIAYITPENYYVEYDSDTETYYYVFRDSSNTTLEVGNKILEAQEVLGTLTIGEDVLGSQTIMQLKIKINKKGRSIKVILKDGFNDITKTFIVDNTSNTLCTYERLRNDQNFSIIAMGIVYKLKKVKEG